MLGRRRLKMMKGEKVRNDRTIPVGSIGKDDQPLGVYKPGAFQDESKAFFLQCVGRETYDRAMNSEAGRRHHYVAARAFLSQSDWVKFVWIEQHGSLAGYPG